MSRTYKFIEKAKRKKDICKEDSFWAITNPGFSFIKWLRYERKYYPNYYKALEREENDFSYYHKLFKHKKQKDLNKDFKNQLNNE